MFRAHEQLERPSFETMAEWLFRDGAGIECVSEHTTTLINHLRESKSDDQK